jgi:hypothetical protein
MADRIKRRGLVIIMSDLLDDAEKIISGLKHFRYDRHEVIVFHILDPRERDFAFPREAIFKDMETGEEITTLPYQIKKHYATAVRAFSDEIASACRQSNIDYHPIDPPVEHRLPPDRHRHALRQSSVRLPGEAGAVVLGGGYC